MAYNYSGKSRYNKYNKYKKRYIGQCSKYQCNKLVKDVKYLKSRVHSEFKYLDTVVTNTPTTTAVLALLNGMSKGDGVANREGRQIRVKSILSNTLLTINTSATASNIRIVYFIDKQANAAAPVFGDVFTSSSNYITSARNLNNRKRFVILKDHVYTLDPDNHNAIRMSFYKKLDMSTIYDASDAGDITDIKTNALYMMYICNEATFTPTINSYNRVRFLDS